MSYNGTGTFNINTAGQPVVTGTTITSTAFNLLTADLATGLTTALTKDGQTTPTANIPMGTFKITGLGAGSAATDAAQYGQLQAGATTIATVSGTDTLTGTLTPALAAYATGNLFSFVAVATNTGATTINLNSLGAKSITKLGTTALVAGDIVSGQVHLIEYDGTRFQLINPSTASVSSITFGSTGLTPSTATSGAVTVAGTLAVANGGTGATTLTANNVILGNGTSAPNFVAPSTSGNVLTSNGTTWVSSTPVASSSPVQYPQLIKSANYTLVLADAGYQIFHPATDTAARTFTIPSNASVAFPIGTVIVFVNELGAQQVTVAITTDTIVDMRGITGSKKVNANSILTALKITATKWMCYFADDDVANTALAIANAATPFIAAYAWSNAGFGAKFADPATLPTGIGQSADFSPSGTELVVGHRITPFVTAYSWSSSGFGTKYADPATLPTGRGDGASFSPTGTEVVIAHDITPFVTAYPWSSAGFGVKFSNPATLPTGYGQGVAFSPAGTELAIAHDITPFVTAYPWSSAGFGIKYTNPATLPAGAGYGAAFSPAGTELAISHDVSPFVTAYSWSSSGFGTKFSNPATLPTGTGRSVAFSLAGTEIIIGHNVSPFVTAYPWSSSGFGTKFSNPATLPTAGSYGIAFSPSGLELVLATDGSPFITAYPWSVTGFGTKFANPTSLPAAQGRGVAFAQL